MGEGPVLVCHPGGPGFDGLYFEHLGGLANGERPFGEERIDYLGHSAGGFVGQRYAGRYPQRVRRLLLVGTFARSTDELRAALVEQARLHEHEPWFEEGLQAYARRTARE